MLLELKKLIEANPLFREKLTFPVLKASRLRTLINQRYIKVYGNPVLCCWEILVLKLLNSKFLYS